MVLVILLENVFKLSIYLDIYIFLCVGILPAWSVEASVKDFKFIEAFILRCPLITCANKTRKILKTLKLTADLIKA